MALIEIGSTKQLFVDDYLIESLTNTKQVLNPGQKPDTEFYAMPAVTYESWYVGMLWVFRTTNVTHHPEIVFSRDGVHYQRTFRQPFIQRGDRRVDSNSIYAGVPIVRDDQIYTFYHGINWRSPETMLELGDKATGAVGLAITPLDGFVSRPRREGAPPARAKCASRF